MSCRGAKLYDYLVALSWTRRSACEGEAGDEEFSARQEQSDLLTSQCNTLNDKYVQCSAVELESLASLY